MTSHDVERAYVQSRVDDADRRLADAAAEMQADLDRLTESWATSAAEARQAHEARLAELEESRLAYLRGLHTNEDGGPPPSPPNVHQGRRDASSGLNPPASRPGPGPGGPNPYDADELEMAEAIRSMDMAEFARSRAEFGIRSPSSMAKLFGER